MVGGSEVWDYIADSRRDHPDKLAYQWKQDADGSAYDERHNLVPRQRGCKYAYSWVGAGEKRGAEVAAENRAPVEASEKADAYSVDNRR